MTRRLDQAGDAGFEVPEEVPEEYAELVDRVCRHLAAASFDPATRARHLHRLRELAAVQPLPRSVRGRVGSRWAGLSRRVAGTAVASLTAITLSTTAALAAASSNALPGEALYDTKLLVEQAHRAVVLTKEGEVAVLVDQAQNRIEEVHKLVELGAEPELVAVTLGTFEQQLHEAEAVAGDDQGLKQEVATMAVEAAVALGELQSQNPELDPNAEQAIVVAKGVAMASAAPDTAGSSPAPQPSEAAVAEPGGSEAATGDDAPSSDGTASSGSSDQEADSITGSGGSLSPGAVPAEPPPAPSGGDVTETPTPTPSPSPSPTEESETPTQEEPTPEPSSPPETDTAGPGE